MKESNSFDDCGYFSNITLNRNKVKIDKNLGWALPYCLTKDQLQTRLNLNGSEGYITSICDEENDSYIIGVEHIEKDDRCDKFDDDYEAQEQAKKDGVKLLSGFTSLIDDVYLDTVENRIKLQKHFEENPSYRVIDKEGMSELINEALNRYFYLNLGDSLNSFSKHLDLSPVHLSRIIRKLINITNTDVVNKLLSKTELDKSDLLDCLEPIKEKFI